MLHFRENVDTLQQGLRTSLNSDRSESVNQHLYLIAV